VTNWSRAVISFSLVILSASSSLFSEPSAKCAKTLTWLAKVDSIQDKLTVLVSLLSRHPNIITVNLSFKRSLLDTYGLVPELRRQLGANAASFETPPADVRRVRYVAAGEVRHNKEGIDKFLEARVSDMEGLDLVDGADLSTQIRAIKQSSKRADGTFDGKVFAKKVRKVLQVVPFLFDSDGNPLFKEWKTSQKAIYEQVRAATASHLENRYGDLLKEHLEKQIDAIAAEKGLGQVKLIYENLKNQFLDRELRAVLTPVSASGGVVEERTLSLETLPAWVSIVRGCYGGDCSILTVPYYPLVKGVKVHFIRKSHDLSEQPSGYAISVPVQVGCKTVPYIITINGVTLTKVDIEMAVRLVADDYNSKDIVFPDFKAHPNLVNSDAARQGIATGKQKSVSVKFPPGWGIVDAYMKDHQLKDYTNYYYGPSIERANLGTLPDRELRFLEPPQITNGDGPSYRPVEDLLSIPQLQRAILGAQALEGEQKEATLKQLADLLKLDPKQIQASRPLTVLSSQRSLTKAEYLELEEQLGFGLTNLLDLEASARAPTLRALYHEDPSLFSKQKVRSSSKPINALIDAYGGNFADEIRTILTTKTLSDEQALKLLEEIKPVLKAGDLSKTLEFQNHFKDTSLEAWAKETLPQVFVRTNTADTALGKKLENALTSQNPNEVPFALEALRYPSSRTSPMFLAFQEISQTMEAKRLSYTIASERWLEDQNGSVSAKARYLGMYLNSPRLNSLFSKIPESQKKDVEDAINKFSAFFVFQRAAEKESRAPRASLVRKVGQFSGLSASLMTPQAASLLPASLVAESFEFVDAPIPSEGVTFTMGSPPAETGRYAPYEAQTEVTLTKPFQMQTTDVTRGQYEAVMGKDSSKKSFRDRADSENMPMVDVSWEEAKEFARRISQFDPDLTYDLSFESQFEFMARTGTETAYSHGDDIEELKDYAHFDKNSNSQTQPVAKKLPNSWGLYDMSGNVWKWQNDWHANIITGGVDPQGPPEPGSDRVVRGGSWNGYAQYARSADRGYFRPGDRDGNLGFRLVRTPKALH